MQSIPVIKKQEIIIIIILLFHVGQVRRGVESAESKFTIFSANSRMMFSCLEILSLSNCRNIKKGTSNSLHYFQYIFLESLNGRDLSLFNE